MSYIAYHFQLQKLNPLAGELIVVNLHSKMLASSQKFMTGKHASMTKQNKALILIIPPCILSACTEAAEPIEMKYCTINFIGEVAINDESSCNRSSVV
jgi:hypothetical protein